MSHNRLVEINKRLTEIANKMGELAQKGQATVGGEQYDALQSEQLNLLEESRQLLEGLA